jgi:predicted transcriptional regulator
MDEMQTIYRLSPTRFAAMAKIPLSTVYDYVRQGKISHIQKRSTSDGVS